MQQQAIIPDWSDKYSVNNSKIDKQHKKLFDIAKEAEDMINRQIDAEDIKTIMLELFNYIKFHFADEEEYMAKIGYPKLDEHKLIHKQLISRATDLIKNMRYNFKEKLTMIMEEWVVEHIMQEDKKVGIWYREYVNELNEKVAHKECIIRHLYKCSCRDSFEVSPEIHAKIMAGGKFHCKRCNENIAFIKTTEECIEENFDVSQTEE